MLGKLKYYVARVSVLLITAALIAGMAGCDGCTPSKTWKYGIGMIWMPSGTTWVVITL